VGDRVTGREQESRPDVLSVNTRRAILTVLVAILLVAGAVALLGHLADFHKLRRAADRADLAWFPLCFGGEVLAYLGYILAYRDLARTRGGPRFRYWTVARVVVLGFGANAVGAGAAGLAVDFWALRRAGETSHGSARRVLALNTLEWAVLAVLASLAGLVALLRERTNAPLGMAIGWLTVTPLCVLAAAWVSAPGRADRLTALPDARLPRERGVRAWLRWMRAELRVAFADAIGGVVLVRYMVSRPHRHIVGLVGYPVYWAGNLLALWAAVHAFGGSVQTQGLILAYTTGYVATALPLPAGGAGGIEAALGLTLHAVGVPLEVATLAAVVYRIFTFWIPLLIAVVLVPTLRTLGEELDRTPRDPWEAGDRLAEPEAREAVTS
jgi:uncharacterized membrane protein YbhN (UPF0104 family)